MKVTNGEVFSANEPLVTLLKMAWPVKVSYALVKLANKLSDQFNIVEETRQGLVQKHGDNDDETKVRVVKETSDKYPAFVAEYEELMAQEVELIIEIVRLPTEVNGTPFMVEPQTLLALQKFVKAE